MVKITGKKSGGLVILTLALFFLALLALSSVSAFETKVEVTTFPYHNVSLNAVDPYEGNVVASLKGISDNYGKSYFNISSEFPTMRISIVSRKNGKIIQKGIFGNYSAGNVITINLFGEEEETDTSETVEEDLEETNEESSEETEEVIEEVVEEVQEETTDTESIGEVQLTGEAISDEEAGTFSNSLYIIIIAGVLFVGLIVFLSVKLMHKKGSINLSDEPEKIKVTKYSDLKDKIEDIKDSKKLDPNEEKELAEAEKKILEAQEEIRKIKEKKGKLKEAQEEFEKAKKKLEDLQKEADKD